MKSKQEPHVASSKTRVLVLRVEDPSLGWPPIRDGFLFLAAWSRENIALKGLLGGCPTIEKSITTQARELGHIMRPKLQIPFNVYGIKAITRQSILALLHLPLPVIHKHSSSGYFQKDGFRNKGQHSEGI